MNEVNVIIIINIAKTVFSLINIGNIHIMNRAYDESEMRTRQNGNVTPGEH